MSFYPPMQQQHPIQCMPQAMTPTSIDSYDMEIVVADANGPMVQLVTKRKFGHDNEDMLFKRQRLQCKPAGHEGIDEHWSGDAQQEVWPTVVGSLVFPPTQPVAAQDFKS
ncbi:hypothetical protein SPRG_12578 [Saprolegnia parasitica CBS 223.65]|uniref:Uncharacterized protein n=1 Tax=Saprolegnia parasitica (strain CBS 223.65) TaxID=695850 RepID=A0A067BWE4_SAPPC|nr:hypothetical protein SPRG_12578 [Saprolegnia parasitica CBS 223.65]KDO22598.1 hypothetical protein SPRG_12578 [Saprolegnia parasitica CBS 223.65]|eukprot:XP_012206714.1 hypothetical protein SPRG_12578 [Saprolegnia parasitica CBS 223.65]